MKQILFSFFVLFSITAIGQNNNPFESIGKESAMLSLSNGRYEEVFKNEKLRRVGSVMMNTETMKIDHFLTEEELKECQDLETEKQASRFLSIDPLTRSFPMLTPFQYGSNNPIMNIDLDGLEGVNFNALLPNFFMQTKISTTTANTIINIPTNTGKVVEKLDEINTRSKGPLSNNYNGIFAEGGADPQNSGTFTKQEIKFVGHGLDVAGTVVEVGGYGATLVGFPEVGLPAIATGKEISTVGTIMVTSVELSEGNFIEPAVTIGFGIANKKIGGSIMKDDKLGDIDKEIIRESFDLKSKITEEATKKVIDDEINKKE